jgi:predicted permease
MDWKGRVAAAFAAGSHTPDADVIEELAQHARAMYDAARADGCSHDEADARVAAQIDRWRLEGHALRHRSRRAPLIEPPPAAAPSRLAGLTQDVRYAARLLRRQPRFALLVTMTMSLGICATTVLFSVTYGVLMKPLPWPSADRLIVLKETRGGNPPRFNSFSNAAYLAWRDEATTIDGIAAWSARSAILAGAGDPERIRITATSASLFTLLETRPLIGSLFGPNDEQSKDGDVVVVSEGLWRQRFNGDPSIVGRAVRLDGKPHTIVGVLADGAAFPDRQSRAWVPFRVPLPTGNYMSMFSAIARLKPGATAAQAAAEGTSRGRFAADTGMTTMAIFGSRGPIEITATPLKDATTADVRRPIVMLLVAVVLLLVTATANVASLQLARATTRYREMAIRAALGAGGARIIRQLLVESLILGLLGGTAGLGLASLLHATLPSLLPADFPRAADVGLSAPVVVFAVAVSMLAGVACGLLPALRARRLNLVDSLAEDGGGSVGAGGRSRTARIRLLIMGGQVAIACMLLVGASLLGRSFVALVSADRGYDPAGILTARLSLSSMSLTPERRHAVVGQILDRLAAMPAVRASAFTSEMPLTPGGSTATFPIPSRRGDGASVPVQVSNRVVSPQAFAALGMRVVAGRGFTEADTETSQPVAVVNRRFARRYLDDSALDARVPMGVGYQDGHSEATIVGVVEDIRYLTAQDSSQPELYYSFRQLKGRLPLPVVTLLVRTDGDPSALAPALRSAVRESNSGLVAESVMTMEDRMLTAVARPRLYAILLGGFAACALAIAAVGLFGVLSYSVAQRSREIAVRSALGARQADIVRLVVRQGLAVTVGGLTAGLIGSIALSRAIAAQLYGVTTHDAVTYIMVPLLLVAVAAISCVAPARRAARLDPLKVLRGS